MALARHLIAAGELIFEEAPADGLLLDRWAGLVEECRTGRAVLDRNCGKRVFKPQSCDVRLCPDCERARSARLVARYDTIAGDMARARHWTFTLPNVAVDGLRDSLAVLLDAQAHLRRRAIFAGGPCGGEHRAVAWEDPATGEHHPSGDDVAACSHPRHRKELAAVGSCRCARCLEAVVSVDGYRVTVTGCPRCVHFPVAGGVYGIEVTWSKQGDWHPHVHVLMDAPWIVWSEVRDAWQEVTCDATRRAEARSSGSTERLAPCRHLRGWEKTGKCHGCRAETDGVWCGNECRAASLLEAGCRGASVVWVSDVKAAPGTPERRKAVVEVLKYVSKGLLDKEGHLLPGAGPLQLAELLLSIRGRRLVAGWGSFRNVHDDEDEERDTVPVWTGDIDRYGRDVILRMPRICPCCGDEASWGSPIKARRVHVRRNDAGVLIWQPPGGAS